MRQAMHACMHAAPAGEQSECVPSITRFTCAACLPTSGCSSSNAFMRYCCPPASSSASANRAASASTAAAQCKSRHCRATAESAHLRSASSFLRASSSASRRSSSSSCRQADGAASAVRQPSAGGALRSARSTHWQPRQAERGACMLASWQRFILTTTRLPSTPARCGMPPQYCPVRLPVPGRLPTNPQPVLTRRRCSSASRSASSWALRCASRASCMRRTAADTLGPPLPLPLAGAASARRKETHS